MDSVTAIFLFVVRFTTTSSGKCCGGNLRILGVGIGGIISVSFSCDLRGKFVGKLYGGIADFYRNT